MNDMNEKNSKVMSEKVNKALYIAISLLVAVLFWVYVDNEQGNTITADFSAVPIEFIGAADTLPSRDLMVSKVSTETVDLTLSGPRAAITNLKKSDIVLQVNLSGINSMGTYPLDYDLVLTNTVRRSDITIDRASVSSVTVKVIEMYEKTVPVDVSIIGAVAEGYIFMSDLLVAEPSSITLTGPEEQVDEVSAAQIMVDLTGANETVSREFDYQLLDSEGNVVDGENITVSHKRVEVTAPLYITKTLELKVKTVESPGSMLENVDVRINPSAIEVAGEPAWLAGKESITLGELRLKDYLRDTTEVMVIELPTEGCVNVSGVNSATVVIDFQDLETRVFTVTNISAIGAKEGSEVSRVTNSVDVRVRGPREDLETMTGEEIRIVVDLSGYTANGTHNVPAEVLVDGYANVGAVGPCSVTYKIAS